MKTTNNKIRINIPILFSQTFIYLHSLPFWIFLYIFLLILHPEYILIQESWYSCRGSLRIEKHLLQIEVRFDSEFAIFGVIEKQEWSSYAWMKNTLNYFELRRDKYGRIIDREENIEKKRVRLKRICKFQQIFIK